MNNLEMNANVDGMVTASDSNSSTQNIESDRGSVDCKSDHDDGGNSCASDENGFEDNLQQQNGEQNDDGDDNNVDDSRRQDVRKLRRVMANRRSARESRERRKKLLADLQESVDKLTEENGELERGNLAMQQELITLLRQYGFLPLSLQM